MYNIWLLHMSVKYTVIRILICTYMDRCKEILFFDCHLIISTCTTEKHVHMRQK